MLCEHWATNSSLPPHGHQGEAKGVKHTVGRFTFVLVLGDLDEPFSDLLSLWKDIFFSPTTKRSLLSGFIFLSSYYFSCLSTLVGV